jgi:hypothetical protein
MALIFQEQIKKQKNLIFVFFSLTLITAFIIWFGYFRKEESVEELISEHFKKIEIDFNILQNPLLKEFQFIEKIPPFDGEIGRENPFVPY